MSFAPEIVRIIGTGEKPQQSELLGFNPTEIIDQDRQGRWYEISRTDVSESPLFLNQSAEWIAGRSRVILSPLTEYAEKYGIFVVIGISRQADGTDKWTFMPGYIASRREHRDISQRYQEVLEGSWAHIVIDPGETISEKIYSDSEQLGLSDEIFSDGSYAFDVCREYIRWDELSLVRDKLVWEEKGWQSWAGDESPDFVYEHFGSEIEQKARTRFRLPRLLG